MGSKTDQLLTLKEEEKLLLTFRSRINDQLNRLKVEELTILSLMRRAREEVYSKDEINLDISPVVQPPVDPAPTYTRDLSHLTSMTGGFRASGVTKIGSPPSEMTSFELDLGDFETGNVDANFDVVSKYHLSGEGSPSAKNIDLTPLNLALSNNSQLREEEEEEEEDEIS